MAGGRKIPMGKTSMLPKYRSSVSVSSSFTKGAADQRSDNPSVFPFAAAKTPDIKCGLDAPVQDHCQCDTDDSHSQPLGQQEGQKRPADDGGKNGSPHGKLYVTRCPEAG